MAVLKPQEFPTKLDRYIQNYLAKDLSAAAICSYFQISRINGKAKLWQGCDALHSPTTYKKAKDLLLNNEAIRIKEVAFAHGFPITLL